MVYRQINIALESLSLIICCILLLYQFVERKTENKSKNWFTAMIVCNIVMLIGDMSDWVLGGVPGKASFYAQYVLSVVLFFATSGVLLYALFGWLISYISQKATISKAWMYCCKVLLGGQVLLAVTMPIHKIAYINPETNLYARGNYFLITQICPDIMYILAVILLIRYRKQFKKSEMGYLFLFLAIPMVAEIIQVSTYTIGSLNVAISVGLIVVLTFIQSQRQLESEQQISELITAENKKLEDMQIFQENLSEQLIEALCSTVEAKDHYTRGHSLRVAQYAREIMYRMGGDEQAQKEVYYIGILHDVGKISVKDEIINKKGRLTDEEFEQIKLHTIAGYQILRNIDVIPDLAIGARWHHERYDGTGYPNGLAGENIPLVARIISVADAYDAMTSNRSYHSTMPQEVVRDQIVRGMGSQFDPNIARIMLEMIDEDMQYEMKQVNFNKAINILLIDDDTVVHKLVQHALIEENYILTSAYSGTEGIELMQDQKFDLCLLDMEMPGMNGFEVLEWIRKNVRKLKVIFLTGDKDIETIRKSEKLGAVDYVTKPVSVTILKESINAVLTHH